MCRHRISGVVSVVAVSLFISGSTIHRETYQCIKVTFSHFRPFSCSDRDIQSLQLKLGKLL